MMRIENTLTSAIGSVSLAAHVAFDPYVHQAENYLHSASVAFFSLTQSAGTFALSIYRPALAAVAQGLHTFDAWSPLVKGALVFVGVAVGAVALGALVGVPVFSIAASIVAEMPTLVSAAAAQFSGLGWLGVGASVSAGALVFAGCGSPSDDDSATPTPSQVTWVEDNDKDGYGKNDGKTQTLPNGSSPGDGGSWAPRGGDCDDGDSKVNPSASEICNGKDDDCNGTIDDGNVLHSYYLDQDRDGYGVDSASTNVKACSKPDGYAEKFGDADDSDTTVYPNALELCDGKDNNQDGQIDEGLGDAITVYQDADGDGYGNAAVSQAGCANAIPAGYVADNSDCDDTSAAIHPNAVETLNGKDDDCDGGFDSPLYIYDSTRTPSYTSTISGDGFGTAAATARMNGSESGVAAVSAPYDGNYYPDGGAVHFFINPSDTSATRRPVFYGDQDDQVGKGLSSAGDANGDGYDDLLIATNGKGALLLYGHSGFDNPGILTSDDALRLTGEASDDQAGTVVAGLGTMGGDGTPWIGVGAPANNKSSAVTDTGKVYFFEGGTGSVLDAIGQSNSLSSASILITGKSKAQKLGTVLSSAGDVNGDGYADVLISDASGNVYLADGKTLSAKTGTLTLDDLKALALTMTGGPSNPVLAAIGDVNGDGFADFSISSPTAANTAGAANAGKVYMVYGSSGRIAQNTSTSLSSVVAQSYEGANADEKLGSFASAAKITGQSPNHLLLGSAIGAYLVPGGSSLPSDFNNASVTFLPANGSFTGLSGTAGPATNDAKDDLVFGIQPSSTAAALQVFVSGY